MWQRLEGKIVANEPLSHCCIRSLTIHEWTPIKLIWTETHWDTVSQYELYQLKFHSDSGICYLMARFDSSIIIFSSIFIAKILLWLNTGFILSNLLLVNFIGQSKCETKHNNTHLRKIFHYFFFSVHNATGIEYTPSGKRHVLRIKFSTWHSPYPTKTTLAQAGIVQNELNDSTCIRTRASSLFCCSFICGSNDDSTKRWV